MSNCLVIVYLIVIHLTMVVVVVKNCINIELITSIPDALW